MQNLVEILLKKDADPNVRTSKLTDAQTPMHKAIINSHENIIDIFLKFKSKFKSFFPYLNRSL